MVKKIADVPAVTHMCFCVIAGSVPYLSCDMVKKIADVPAVTHMCFCVIAGSVHT